MLIQLFLLKKNKKTKFKQFQTSVVKAHILWSIAGSTFYAVAGCFKSPRLKTAFEVSIRPPVPRAQQLLLQPLLAHLDLLVLCLFLGPNPPLDGPPAPPGPPDRPPHLAPAP